MWLRARFESEQGEPCDEHDEVERSIAAYVLDAADRSEAEMARRHLEDCAACRELAARLARAAAAIPLAAEPVRPPERLRARVLTAARSAPRPGRPAAGSSRRPEGRVTGGGGGRRRGLVAAVAVGFALLAVAALLLGVTDIKLAADLSQQSRLNRQLAERNAELSRVNDALSQGPQYHALSGEGPYGGTRGSVVALKNQPVTVIYFTGLPAPGRGKVYELWLTDTGGVRTKGTVFTPDGSGTARVWLDRNLNGISKLGVTVEQGPNGADAPTQASQLKGQIA